MTRLFRATMNALLVVMWACCAIGLTHWLIVWDLPTVAWWVFMTACVSVLTVVHLRLPE